jgi:predicted dehydrogenase
MQRFDTLSQMSRRRFVTSAAAASAVTILKPSLVRGAQANSVLELGLIGCGGRGQWIAPLFVNSGKYKFVACADYFQDRVDAVGNKFGIDPSRRHAGLSGYRRLLDGKLDAVVIESPPGFHPEHAARAVEAGKHVFIAKPIAVDAPGCLAIGAAGRQATAKKLVFLVDFQTRANEHYREALRRVRKGDIGQIVMGEAHYPWSGGGRSPAPKTPEERLRTWYYVTALSGDFIVEQSIHALDVATWIIDADPIRAVGGGGRKLRAPGTIWDHFAVNYWFPSDVVLSFTCIQTIPAMKDEIRARVYGSQGYIDTDYFGNVFIRGDEPYKGGSTGNLYTDGAMTNIHEFHEFITKGDGSNPTVAPSVRANLTAVLGREAGYRGGEFTLEELIKANQKLEFDITGLKG